MVGLGPGLFRAQFLQRSQLWLNAEQLPPSTMLVKTLLPFSITCTPWLLTVETSSWGQHFFSSPSTDTFLLRAPLSPRHSSAPAPLSFLGLGWCWRPKATRAWKCLPVKDSEEASVWQEEGSGMEQATHLPWRTGGGLSWKKSRQQDTVSVS